MYIYIYTAYIYIIYIYYIYYILYIYYIYYIIYISADPGRRKGERIGAERLWTQPQPQQQQEEEQEQEQEQEQQEEEDEEQAQAQKCDKKMCGKMVTSCGIKRTSHCALLLRARAEHMNTTMHNPYGIAGVRSSIEYSI